MQKALSTTIALMVLASGIFEGMARAASNPAHFALVIPMPEPSSPALLSIDLAAVGLLLFFFRRRITR